MDIFKLMFAKLFQTMYDGTLCSVGPWEALVTFQQLLILKDPAGVVDMTPEAISRRTTIPVDIIRRGIEALEKPDPASRTPDDDGRRIRRLDAHRDWGWQIVNHEKYRNMRSNEDRRDYFREYKRTQRAEGKKASPSAAPDATGFDRFWSAYPRKVAKPSAVRAFKAAKIENGSLEAVLAALEAQKRSPEWAKEGGRFIPHPATWLNGRRWEDQRTEAALPPGYDPRKLAI